MKINFKEINLQGTLTHNNKKIICWWKTQEHTFKIYKRRKIEVLAKMIDKFIK